MSNEIPLPPLTPLDSMSNSSGDLVSQIPPPNVNVGNGSTDVPPLPSLPSIPSITKILQDIISNPLGLNKTSNTTDTKTSAENDKPIWKYDFNDWKNLFTSAALTATIVLVGLLIIFLSVWKVFTKGR